MALNEELSREGIVQSVGNATGVAVSDMDISVTHPIPSFNTAAPPKIIVKFTKREACDRFYSNRKNLARKQIKDIPGLGSPNHLRQAERSSFNLREINKIKSKKWKFTWIYNGRIISSARGAGLYLHVADDLNFIRRYCLELPAKVFESPWIETMSKKEQNVTIGCLYRHPHSNFESFHEVMKEQDLNNSSKQVIGLGDTNVNFLRY